MGKIPVGRVIGQTFEFSFKQYPTVLGIIWLPMLLMGVLGYFLLLPFVQQIGDLVLRHLLAHPQDTAFPFPMTSGMFGRIWLFDILILLLFAMIGVGITKEVLGMRTGPRFVYFSFGAPELRSIGSYVIVLAILYAGFLAIAIVGVILAILVALLGGLAFQNLDSGPLGGVIVGSVAIILFGAELAALYVAIRLGYLILPVAVAEGRIGVGRSWELTRGNFWRIVGIWLVTLLPLFLVEIVFVIAVLAPTMGLLAQAAQEGQQAFFARMQALTETYIRYLPWTWAASFVLAPILYALWIAPSAFAYRALVPLQPGQPPDTAPGASQ